MKTKILLAGLAVGILGFFSNLNAQAVTGTGTLVAKGTPTTPAGQEDEDYVTVGSTMPYQVTGFDWGTLSGSVTPLFNWSVTTAGTGTADLFKNDGTSSLTEDADYTGFYQENSISIKWNAVGSYTINVAERGKFSSTASCPDATPETLGVNVLPWPTVAWGTITNPSTCGLESVSLPLTIKGSKSITVTYDVFFTALATGSTEQEIASDQTQVFTNTGYDVAVAGATLDYDVDETKFGTYRIRITNIQDKITEKSFGNLDVADARRNATATELPGTDVTFYNLPTPTTQPIQHIKNL